MADFNGCFARATELRSSGESDDQVQEAAMKLYESEHDGKAFKYHHVWNVVKDQPKWCTWMGKLAKERAKAKSGTEKPSVVVNLADRPMGHKRAKDERNGKRKESGGNGAINEKLDKFIEVIEKATTVTREDREKMEKVQDRLADKKLEAAKLAHKAAQEQTKCRMLQSYTELALADTSKLNEEALAERNRALSL